MPIVSSRVVLHFSKEGSDMLFEWLWNNVSRRLQLVTGEVRAWKLFLLLPFMLLRRPIGQGRVGKEELSIRFDKFSDGQWGLLAHEALKSIESERPRMPRQETAETRGKTACQKIRMGEVSRARQYLTGATLAPGNDQTLQELQRRRDQEVVRPLSQEVLEFDPERPVILDRPTFLTSLKSAPRGSSPGPGGCTYEHLKTLLDESDTTELLFGACSSSLAQAKVPEEVASVLMGARLTALTKPDGGVRGIATGCSLRRLVAQTLEKQFMAVFEAECAPFQYALSTRAGTDCVGHMLRAATDADPRLTILSVDGIGAYDHIVRSAMLGRLLQMPGARQILPFVRLSYAQPSTYGWFDEDGKRRAVSQAEGGEQGDWLMPLLFSIGIQSAHWNQESSCVLFSTTSICSVHHLACNTSTKC